MVLSGMGISRGHSRGATNGIKGGDCVLSLMLFPLYVLFSIELSHIPFVLGV